MKNIFIWMVILQTINGNQGLKITSKGERPQVIPIL